MKTYTVLRTVYEYYYIEANSEKEALALPLVDPYVVTVKSEKVVPDVLEQSKEQKQ